MSGGAAHENHVDGRGRRDRRARTVAVFLGDFGGFGGAFRNDICLVMPANRSTHDPISAVCSRQTSAIAFMG